MSRDPQRIVRHGSPCTYTNHKCRCDECRIAWNAYMKRLRHSNPQRFRKSTRERKWRRLGRVPTQPCELCGEIFVAVSIHKAGVHGVPGGACGTITGYLRGCRCGLCRLASRNAQRDYRARKRAGKVGA